MARKGKSKDRNVGVHRVVEGVEAGVGVGANLDTLAAAARTATKPLGALAAVQEVARQQMPALSDPTNPKYWEGMHLTTGPHSPRGGWEE